MSTQRDERVLSTAKHRICERALFPKTRRYCAFIVIGANVFIGCGKSQSWCARATPIKVCNCCVRKASHACAIRWNHEHTCDSVWSPRCNARAFCVVCGVPSVRRRGDDVFGVCVCVLVAVVALQMSTIRPPRYVCSNDGQAAAVLVIAFLVCCLL